MSSTARNLTEGPETGESFSGPFPETAAMIQSLLSLLRPAPADPGLAAGRARSPHWRVIEQAHLKLEPCCQVCGTRKALDVHHVVPYHLDPARELDRTNLITLCRAHHLLFGHLMAWARINARVRADAAEWRQRIAASKVA